MGNPGEAENKLVLASPKKKKKKKAAPDSLKLKSMRRSQCQQNGPVSFVILVVSVQSIDISYKAMGSNYELLGSCHPSD